jgi:hypothetical protein
LRRGPASRTPFLAQRGLRKVPCVEGTTQRVSEIVGRETASENSGQKKRDRTMRKPILHFRPTALIKIARREVLRKLEEPDFAKPYISVLVHGVHQYEGSLAERVFKQSEQRLVRALIGLMKFDIGRTNTLPLFRFRTSQVA